MTSYRYVDGEYINEIEIKKSKFITYVIGEVTSENVENKIKEIRKTHSKATHCTYAYITEEGAKFKFNDDGEPQGTAGKPILSVLQNKEIVNTLVCIVRYFGGIKLGANGLVNAYNNSAVQAVENSKLSTKHLCYEVEIKLDYEYCDNVKNLININGKCTSVEYFETVKIIGHILVPKYQKVISSIHEITSAKVEIIIKGEKHINCEV